MDYLIRQAFIVDGSGQPAHIGDLGITGNEITGLGRLDPAEAAVVIEGQGQVLCPGFIDMHSHSDALFANGDRVPHKLSQGVTTELIGQDGISAAPLTEFSIRGMAEIIEPLAGPLKGGWPVWNVDEFLSTITGKGAHINVMTLTGHCNLRMAVMGHKMARADAQDLRRMGDHLAQSMDQGSHGLSLGLIYPPSSYSDTDELIALGRVVREKGGVVVAHIRDEQAGILDALTEMTTIGRESGARIHISHLKCLGADNWGRMPQVLELLDRASADGVRVSFDQYPYDASCTTLSLLVPGWALEGGWEGFRRKVDQSSSRREVTAGIQKAISGRGGADSIRMASLQAKELDGCVGRTLAQVAATWDVEPAEAACRILYASRLGAIVIYHAMSPEDVERAMTHPLHTVGSDGVLGAFPHPRAYGTFPRVIGNFHRRRGLMTLETAVRDMTWKPAEIMGLSRRGRIEVGYWADVLLFEPDRFADHATYDQPTLPPTGLTWVFVNGTPAIEAGRQTTNAAGAVLRHHGPA